MRALNILYSSTNRSQTAIETYRTVDQDRTLITELRELLKRRGVEVVLLTIAEFDATNEYLNPGGVLALADESYAFLQRQWKAVDFQNAISLWLVKEESGDSELHDILHEEVKRLWQMSKKQRKILPVAAPLADGSKSGRRLTPKFPKRAAWLKAELRKRHWNKNDLQRWNGPDRKTTQ